MRSRTEPLLPDNPVRRLSQTRSWHRNKLRTTVIKAHQLPAWMQAVQEVKRAGPGSTPDTIADFLLLALFTGLRRGEAATLTRDQVDLRAKTLTPCILAGYVGGRTALRTGCRAVPPYPWGIHTNTGHPSSPSVYLSPGRDIS